MKDTEICQYDTTEYLQMERDEGQSKLPVGQDKTKEDSPKG